MTFNFSEDDVRGNKIRKYTDDEVRALKKIAKHPKVQEFMKHDAITFLDSLEQQKFKYKDGNYLRETLIQTLESFPFMGDYIHTILLEAQKRKYKFDDDGDWLK